LFFLIGDTDLIKDLCEIVGDDGVSRQLREETEGDEDQETMTITFCLQEFKDAVSCKLLLKRKSSFDFSEDELDSDIVFVVKGEVVGQNLEGALWSILLNIPTGRFT
jgi:hypothetical protein